MTRKNSAESPDSPVRTAKETSKADTSRSAKEKSKAEAAEGVAEGDPAEAPSEPEKDSLADHGQRLAQDLRDAAGLKGSDSFQGRLLDTLANGVAEFSEKLRDQNFSTILDQAEGLARRNPGVFVAGAALTGFAATRFVRAASEKGVGKANPPRANATSDASAARPDDDAPGPTGEAAS